MVNTHKNVKTHTDLIAQQFIPSYLPNQSEHAYSQKTCYKSVHKSSVQIAKNCEQSECPSADPG